MPKFSLAGVEDGMSPPVGTPDKNATVSEEIIITHQNKDFPDEDCAIIAEKRPSPTETNADDEVPLKFIKRKIKKEKM